ncbi:MULTISPECIES: hypothetical protein [Neisseria]
MLTLPGAAWAFFSALRATIRLKGNFGKSHEAAVKLGLKEQADD